MNNTSYEVNLHWNSKTQGILSSPVSPDKIEVVTPPEFPGGMSGKWTSEHLFVGAVNSCLMSTFLLIAENSKLEFIAFESNAVGKMEEVDGKFSMTEIVLKPKLIIPSTQHEDRAIRILEMSLKNCAISNSIKSKISLEPIIIVK